MTVKINNHKVASTSHEIDRVWNQTLRILCAHPPNSVITISLKTNCATLGKIHISAQQILTKESFINGFFSLCMENGKTNQELKLRFMLWFTPAELEPSWDKLLENGRFQGLKNSAFPQRSNCSATLDQDTHHRPAFQPPNNFCGTPRKLWEDLYKAIEDAQHLIYIAGWSFNPKFVQVCEVSFLLNSSINS